MSDVNLAASPTTSQLALVLAQHQPDIALAPYRGVLTPVEFDVRAVEIEALVVGAAVHDLGWRRRVALRGEDRFRWLSGMVTNTVKDLPERGGAWNLVLNAQGRIQGDLTVWRDGEELELDIAADQFDKLMGHLDRFIIMDDVEMAPVDPSAETVLGITGPKAGTILLALSLPVPDPMTQVKAEWNGISLLIRGEYGAIVPHFSLWIASAHGEALWSALQAAGARPVGSAALESLRISEGIPIYGIDIAERDLPQETSQMRALHFTKGCYLGQEIVERIRSRGNVHRHLRLLEADGPVPAPATELLLDGTAAGNITSAAALQLPGGFRVFALGMVRAEAEARNQALQYTTAGTSAKAQLLSGSPTF